MAASLLDDSLPRAREDGELAVASDHRNRCRGPLPDRGRRTQCEPRLNRRLLTLRHHRRRRAVLDRAAGALVRVRSDEHRSDGRCRLEPGSGVHDVTCDERLPVLGACVERDDRLAGVHGDAQLDALELGPVADCERGADRPFGVVAVRDRRAEDAHHGIADELLHAASVALELAADVRVVRHEECADILGIELLRARREPDEIDEEDGHDATLLTRARGLAEGATHTRCRTWRCPGSAVRSERRWPRWGTLESPEGHTSTGRRRMTSTTYRRRARRGVRRAHARHAERRRAHGDDLGRSSDRSVRRTRGARGRDEPGARRMRPGSNERYVREWLGAMTTGRIVELDPATARYSLPAGARRVADAGGVSGQSRGRGAVDHDALGGRGRHHRVLPRTAAGCRTSGTRASTR